MTGIKEALNSSPRELEFWGGGKAESIKRGFAITSLRNLQDSYDFRRGERILAYCRDDKEKVPVIIVSNDFLPLSSHEIPVLALDGVFDHLDAAKMLRQYPSYEKTDVDTPLRAIVFLDADKFDSLPTELQEHLINSKNSIISLIRDKKLRELFFPTICYWIAETGGTLSDYSSYLFVKGLISEEECAQIEAYNREKGKLSFDEEPKHLQQLSISPRSGLFRPLILGLFD